MLILIPLFSFLLSLLYSFLFSEDYKIAHFCCQRNIFQKVSLYSVSVFIFASDFACFAHVLYDPFYLIAYREKKLTTCDISSLFTNDQDP